MCHYLDTFIEAPTFTPFKYRDKRLDVAGVNYTDGFISEFKKIPFPAHGKLLVLLSQPFAPGFSVLPPTPGMNPGATNIAP